MNDDIFAVPMTLEETQAFADDWNRANLFDVGYETHGPNMRVESPGLVYWNAYDSPAVHVATFVALALLNSPTLVNKVKVALGV